MEASDISTETLDNSKKIEKIKVILTKFSDQRLYKKSNIFGITFLFFILLSKNLAFEINVLLIQKKTIFYRY